MNTNADDLAVMHATHGTTPGERCKDCAFCRHGHRRNNATVTHASSHRHCLKAARRMGNRNIERLRLWKATWAACGLFRRSEV